MTNEEIIGKARELGAAIQDGNDFAAFLLAKTAADKNAELQDLLGQFNLRKVDLNRAITAKEKDFEKIAALNKEVKDLYDKIIANPHMMAYTTTKTELDKTVRFVQQIILESAAGENPYEIEEEEACGGDCSSCGGCH